jgi:hypothetical protein
VLEINGLTVVPAGRYLKIVEATGIERKTIPIYEDGSPIPASDPCSRASNPRRETSPRTARPTC